MSASQRRKGQVGEREVARLIHEHLGFTVRRRVRQDAGDSDLVGVPGWSVEVKNHKTATRACLKDWWAQTAAQGLTEALLPALVYKRAPGWWRVVWPLDWQDSGLGFEWVVEGEIETWAAQVRESL